MGCRSEQRPNHSMKPRPHYDTSHRVCHDTLPWLISFSLDRERARRRFLFVFLGERKAFRLFAANRAFPHVISAVVVSHRPQYSPACHADSSSTNAVSFSSARTTKRFTLPRWASAMQIVRPSESTAETQPQLQPALLRLSALNREL